MNRIHLPLSSVASDSFNAALAASFRIAIPDDVMVLPATVGKGLLYRKQTDPGLILVFWKLLLRKELSVFKRPAGPAENSSSLSIIYLLQGGPDNQGQQNKDAAGLTYNRTILLVSDKSAFRFRAPAGEPVKIIVIDIGTAWLKKEFSVSNRFYDTYFNALHKKVGTSTLHYTATMEESKLLMDIEGQINMGSENLLFLKAKTFLLISDFFSRFIKRPLQASDHQKLLHYEQMMEVESILKAHLEKKLPELPALAKQFSISPSTLKRHFKTVFKKNIYQYYLELKMNYAKALFIEKSLSVNEVAGLLQYENVSGFIEMFKKHHGVSPGAVVKGG